jgi:hypothetical protein
MFLKYDDLYEKGKVSERIYFHRYNFSNMIEGTVQTSNRDCPRSFHIRYCFI